MTHSPLVAPSHDDAAELSNPWLRALRALGIAALVIAALFVVIGFLLLPVVPA